MTTLFDPFLTILSLAIDWRQRCVHFFIIFDSLRENGMEVGAGEM